jgi:predicted RNA-binding protein with RPS1 domain
MSNVEYLQYRRAYRAEIEVYKAWLPWKNRPHFLWSLADMLKAFKVTKFDNLLRRFRALESSLQKEMEKRGARAYLKADGEQSIYSPQDIEDLIDDIPSILVSDSVQRLGIEATDTITGGVLQEIYFLIRALREGVEAEAESRLFLYVPSNNEVYLRNRALFGDAVNDVFSGAASDIENAGTCYALEVYTACVFHLMRVVEQGLRALAETLSIGFEVESWGRVIDQIEAAIKAIDQEPKSPDKIEKQLFYSEAAAQFRYFKNAWRNHAMHAKQTYDEDQAKKIMANVREFMVYLATTLPKYQRNKKI